MGGPRDGAILAMLAIAWLQSAVGVKDHVVALDATSHPLQEDAIENEVSFANDELTDHPHRMPGKPSKLDMNVNQMIQTDDKSQYQVEAARMENATVSSCQDDVTVPCARKDVTDMLDRLSRIDTYNVTDGVQIIRSQGAARKDEKGNDRTDASLLDKVRRYAREHVVKIRLSRDMVPGRKARTFFNGESTVSPSHAFVTCVPASREIQLAMLLWTGFTANTIRIACHCFHCARGAESGWALIVGVLNVDWFHCARRASGHWGVMGFLRLGEFFPGSMAVEKVEARF